jgi:hypothetical protein
MPVVATVADAAVKTANGGSINAGIWTLVGVVVSTLGLVWLAYIKQWGPWRQAESNARDADFARLRSDIGRQDDRISKLETLVETANATAAAASAHAVRADAKLQTALTACEVLLGLVEREMPQASEIPLVKRLLAQAAADDLGVGAGMRKIAMMKGVG